MGRSHGIESIANEQPSLKGTGLEDVVKWERWNEKANRWEPNEYMSKAKEMVKWDSNKIGKQP
jgi:hypothetical protein